MRNGIFIQSPFAEQGDKQEIPFESQPTNVVSWANGYTIDYTLNIQTDPRAKAIERQKQNYLWWALSSVIGQYQREGTPEWVAPTDNGGNPLAYGIGATVIHNGTYWVSLAANNQTEPGAVGATWQVHARIAATNSQAIAGTATDLVITPATLKAVLAAAPGGVQATTTVAGITRYATSAETQGLAVAAAAVTPAGLKGLADSKANATNPDISGRVSQSLPGSPATEQIFWNLAANDAILRWSMKWNGTDGSLTYVGRNAAGNNPQGLITMFPQPSVFGSINDLVMSFGGSIYVVGRVQADVNASETLTSTTRYASYSEVQAGSAANLAVSAKNLAAYNAQYYAPLSNPTLKGTVSVSALDGAFRWIDPSNGVMRFYSNAQGGNGYAFLFNGCNDAGAFNRTIWSADRATGDMRVNANLSVGGTLTAGVLRSTSARWKKNIEGVTENALDKIGNFKVYDGRWKHDAFEGADPSQDHWFLIADEVAKHRKSLCGFDEDGRADSVDYAAIVPLLIAGMQELREENKKLRELITNHNNQD